ncbi:hypothetical protein AAES_22478 [Amazona aestiva]|uniref:Uncharacterized protein n=1 Tax=Amazona aestiva TaxID=12930 RepID=A0A0Q3X784_AMAAE|nr:hypothetical protein AAES_22478 [Amazona aestiva]
MQLQIQVVNTNGVQLPYQHNGVASGVFLMVQQVIQELVGLETAFGAAADNFCASSLQVEEEDKDKKEKKEQQEEEEKERGEGGGHCR